MTNELINKENAFIQIWEKELKNTQQTKFDQKLFKKTSPILIKSLIESSQKLNPSISSEEFLSIAKLIENLLVLQKEHLKDNNMLDYLKSLKIALKKSFKGDEKNQYINQFEKILNNLLSFISIENNKITLLSENINYLETQNHQLANTNIIGQSESIKSIMKEIAPILNNNVTVLINGASGTGKELLARTIYNNSMYNKGPFIAINCAALPENLIESELFGHAKGAFTDAYKDQLGKFELANNGVLFLDEIGELPLHLQSKLLRVLQEKTIIRIGESKERKVNVKLLTATNKNLRQAVNDKTFRDDLYYRLSVYNVTLPPLKNRIDDIEPLATHFLSIYSKEFNYPNKCLNLEAIDLLKTYHWPGNIRELENVIIRAVLKSKTNIIQANELHLDLDNNVSSGQNYLSLKAVEKTHIAKTLKNLKNNIQKTANLLGITRTTLYKKIKEYEINTTNK
jgi:transcriptional regulator with PAS, ATPase and Fis domain